MAESGRGGVTVRECIRVLGEAGERAGVALEPWSERAVREGVCERMVRAEDELELRRGAVQARRRAGIRGVRRRLDLALWP